jgi:hypothetical protein
MTATAKLEIAKAGCREEAKQAFEAAPEQRRKTGRWHSIPGT